MFHQQKKHKTQTSHLKKKKQEKPTTRKKDVVCLSFKQKIPVKKHKRIHQKQRQNRHFRCQDSPPKNSAPSRRITAASMCITCTPHGTKRTTTQDSILRDVHQPGREKLFKDFVVIILGEYFLSFTVIGPPCMDRDD